MKWNIGLTFVLLLILSGCNSDEPHVYWTDKTENQIQRLDEENVKHDIRAEEIWVKEKDMYKVVSCCS